MSYIAGNGITIQNDVISSKTTSINEIGSFKTDGSTIYIDNNNVIHGKKEQKITLSDITLEINAETTTVTVTEHIGDGALSVSSSDTDVVTASISDNTITVTGIDSGEATITVTASATSTYQEATATIAVTVQAVDTRIFGVYWDGSSSPQMTRTDDAVGFADPNPYYAGMSGTPSSPFDDIMPWAGMVRSTDANAGELVAIPKFWYYLAKSGSSMTIKISSAEQTGTGWQISPAHGDRGDGAGVRDVIYVGRYHCANGTYKSTTGVNPQVSKTRATFRSSIHNLGSNIWQNDYATRITLWLLYVVEFANWNSQAKIGYGCGNNSSFQVMGYTDSMPYHTGTITSSRTTYGGTQYRYIEGLWDNVYDWCDGIVFSSFDVYVTRTPSNFGDTTSNHTYIGIRPTSSNEINAWNVYNNATEPWAIYPSSVTSDSNYATYVCDRCGYDSGGVVLCVGGSYGQSQSYGFFYLNGVNDASFSSGYIGSRLMVLPPSRLTSQ